MIKEQDQLRRAQDAKKTALDKRLDSIGWGLFLIMIGGLWLAPEGLVPRLLAHRNRGDHSGDDWCTLLIRY